MERVVPFLDPSVIFDATRRIIDPKTYTGIEGIRAMLAERDEVWGAFRMEPDEFVDGGDRVVAIGRRLSTGRGSGVEVDQPMADVFTLRGGRVVRCEIGYSDRAEALEAAGCGSGPLSLENVEPVRRINEGFNRGDSRNNCLLLVATPDLDQPTHDLDVLLRHRPPSYPAPEIPRDRRTDLDLFGAGSV